MLSYQSSGTAQANPDVELLRQVQALLQAGDRAGARALLLDLDRRNPPLGPNWGIVAQLARATQDMDLAIAAAGKWALDKPGDPQRLAYQFDLLSDIGAGERALAIARALAEAAPTDSEQQYRLGIALARTGELAQAEETLRKAIALRPFFIAAWEQLSIVKKFTPGDPDIDRMREIDRRIPAEHPERPILMYALGKAYDDAGDTDAAFAAFEAGATALFRRKPFDVAPLAGHHRRLAETFSQSFLDHFAGSGAHDRRPIFIFGLPRSGTTLVDRILGAHPAAHMGGEMRLLPLAAAPLKNLEAIDIQQFLDRAQEEGLFDPWKPLGEEYLELLGRRFGPDGLVTDKNLMTHIYVGAIRLMLPEARLIYCRRDPADICWSAYRSRFETGSWWSYDLRTIAQYQHVFEQLIEHWQAIVPRDRLMTIDYEELVTSPEAVISAMLDFVGLPEDPACFEFHTKPATVVTRSLAQVRAPINPASVGGWKRYAEHLKPYLDERSRLQGQRL